MGSGDGGVSGVVPDTPKSDDPTPLARRQTIYSRPRLAVFAAHPGFRAWVGWGYRARSGRCWGSRWRCGAQPAQLRAPRRLGCFMVVPPALDLGWVCGFEPVSPITLVRRPEPVWPGKGCRGVETPTMICPRWGWYSESDLNRLWHVSETCSSAELGYRSVELAGRNCTAVTRRLPGILLTRRNLHGADGQTCTVVFPLAAGHPGCWTTSAWGGRARGEGRMRESNPDP